jgi:hypothetical protein
MTTRVETPDRPEGTLGKAHLLGLLRSWLHALARAVCPHDGGQSQPAEHQGGLAAQAGRGRVLLQHHVRCPVRPVLNPPVPAHQRQHLLRGQSLTGNGGEEHPRLHLCAGAPLAISDRLLAVGGLLWAGRYFSRRAGWDNLSRVALNQAWVYEWRDSPSRTRWRCYEGVRDWFHATAERVRLRLAFFDVGTGFETKLVGSHMRPGAGRCR